MQFTQVQLFAMHFLHQKAVDLGGHLEHLRELTAGSQFVEAAKGLRIPRADRDVAEVVVCAVVGGGAHRRCRRRPKRDAPFVNPKLQVSAEEVLLKLEDVTPATGGLAGRRLLRALPLPGHQP